MAKLTRPRSARAGGRSLGPVADLESQLPAEWWRTLFNATYLRTDGDVVENAANTVADVDLLLAATGLTPEARVLDLCCGQGRHSLELARRGFSRVMGLDRSRYLVNVARRRARGLGRPVVFREGDARSLRPTDGPFDCVAILGNSFGYFDRAEDDLAVLTAVREALRPGGCVAMDISDGDWVRAHFEPRSWEWMDAKHFVCRERMLSADGTRLVCREVVTHTERGVEVDQIYAERLYSRAQMRDLLAAAGFGTVRDHGEVESGSDRNQDLGMMAHRVFLTADNTGAAMRAEVPIAARTPRCEVAVLLGDPRQADAVKRAGAFQPEDLDAVVRLKAALAELPGYDFRFLDDHRTFAAELERRPPDLVFNLCDEGWDNEARRELHVPALLDTLNLPYTGSGPAALAVCFDKALVTATAATMGIPVPTELAVAPGDPVIVWPARFPVLVKPAQGDGGVGIAPGSVARDAAELRTVIARLRAELPGRSLLVQEYLDGAEYTVGLVGNPGADLDLLPVVEIDYSGLDPALPRLLGFDAKFLPDSPYWTDVRHVEAKLDPALRRRLHDYATRLFARFDCRDVARIDFRVGADGVLKLLEINPNPSWRWDDWQATMAGFAGWSYAGLLERILVAARRRTGVGGAAFENALGSEPEGELRAG